MKKQINKAVTKIDYKQPLGFCTLLFGLSLMMNSFLIWTNYPISLFLETLVFFTGMLIGALISFLDFTYQILKQKEGESLD